MSKIDPDITERVSACRSFLFALHLRPGEIVEVLSNPDRHWRNKRGSQNGKERVFYSPSSVLRKIQARILKYLATWPKFDEDLRATAFWRGCSIRENASWHRQNRSSLWIDLENAFESITARHILRYMFRKGLHHLRVSLDCTMRDEERKHYLSAIAWLFSRILTYRGRLRQGPPVSPGIFNIMMEQLDRNIVTVVGDTSRLRTYRGSSTQKPRGLVQLLRQHRGYRGNVYTRYGDDLCISSPEEMFPAELKKRILEVIRRHGCLINYRKIREGKSGVMEFPGVVVVRGTIRPQGKYIAKVARALAQGEMPPRVRQGHRGFLSQFKPQGRPRILRPLLATPSKT